MTTIAVYWLSGDEFQWEPDFVGDETAVRSYLSTQSLDALSNFVVKWINTTESKAMLGSEFMSE